MNPQWDYIGHQIDVSKVLDTDVNLPKIRLISHWVEQIHRYGALQQCSAERPKQAHNMNLKDGWNASSHNLNYLPQVSTFQRRIRCFEIRELNLQALAQCRENSAFTCQVLSFSADLAAPLNPSYMLSPNSCDYKTTVMECILSL
jgi:hypothetical protein